MESLPEVCISDIISRTSPRDACRSSSISRGFKSAADSDTVWDRFLPSDYPSILSRSVSPVVYSTRKELYFRLADSHVLLDVGKMSFSLDKESGKKCYMLAARELPISWGETPYYWRWISLPESRFSEVAELLTVWWLDIRGKVGTEILSPKTTYEAYLVFKLAGRYHGLESAKASIRFVNERDDVPYEEANTVYLQPRTSGEEENEQHGQLPQQRKDGWMEIKTGEFLNDEGDDGEVETRLIEVHVPKSGLIVEGIEFRPKEDA